MRKLRDSKEVPPWVPSLKEVPKGGGHHPAGLEVDGRSGLLFDPETLLALPHAFGVATLPSASDPSELVGARVAKFHPGPQDPRSGELPVGFPVGGPFG